MVALGWTLLALVFLDELLAVTAAGVWGHHAGGVPLAVLMPLATVAVWSFFASPQARYGGPVVRPVAQVLVFALASAGLWAAGHPGWALAMLVFSTVVNGLAQLTSIQALVAEGPEGGGSRDA